MTKVVWDAVGERRFESGLDRGVLYVQDGASGVPWNGLISVDEKSSGGEVQSFYFDGDKYLDVVANEDFLATVTAFTYPDEFDECNGDYEIHPGLFATLQPRKRFDLSYRTLIGNDLDPDLGYKIHLVYNATASPSQKTNTTLSSAATALNFQWDVNCVPAPSDIYKPTAHIVVDSTKVDFPLTDLENLLYGSDFNDPIFPTQGEVISILISLGLREPITEPI